MSNLETLKAQHVAATAALGAEHPVSRQLASALETEDDGVAAAMLAYMEKRGASTTRALAAWKTAELARLRDGVVQLCCVLDVTSNAAATLTPRITARLTLLDKPLRNAARLIFPAPQDCGPASPERVFHDAAAHWHRVRGFEAVHGMGGHPVRWQDVERYVLAGLDEGGAK